jgi:HAD superfamily hydrolase (TIGR01509 family)
MAIETTRIAAVCLDIDGTLMDTDDQAVQRLAGWLGRLPRRLAPREPKTLARRIVMQAESPGNAVLTWLDRLGLDGGLAAIDDLLHRRGLRAAPMAFRPIPGVIEALRALHGNYQLAVVSARGARGVRAFLDHFQLTPLFVTVISGQSLPRTKPHPHPILHAAEQMGVAPQACLMVGDTTVDILSGKAAGAQTVGVLCGFGTEDELRRAGADLILPSTAHLAEVLLPPGRIATP